MTERLSDQKAELQNIMDADLETNHSINAASPPFSSRRFSRGRKWGR
jgi:hypothetical protein